MPTGTAFFPNLTPYFKLDGSRTITGPSTLALDAGGAASDALTIRGASGQTGHLLVLEDSDGINRFTFRPAGRSLTVTDLPPVVGAQTYGDYRQITLTRNPASSTPNDYFSSNGLLLNMTQPSDSTIRNAYAYFSEVLLNGKFNLGYGQSIYTRSSSASTAIDLSASILYAYHLGAGVLTGLEGQQIYTSATGPVTSHIGQIVSAENSGATGTFTGQSVTASHSTGAISTSLIGASITANLSSGSVPTLIGLDVAVTGTGSSATYALRTTGGNILATGPTLTGSTATSLLSLAQTWNTSGTPTAVLLNVTNTASNAASKLIDLQVGGVSQFNVTRGGVLKVTTAIDVPYNGASPSTTGIRFLAIDGVTQLATMGVVGGPELRLNLLSTLTGFTIKNSANATVLSILDGGGIGAGTSSASGRFHAIPTGSGTRGIIAQSNASQTVSTFMVADSSNSIGISMLERRMYLYNTNDGFLSDTATNYERLAFQATSNEYRFTSQAAGTGTIRPVVFLSNTTEILRINASGLTVGEGQNVIFGTTNGTKIGTATTQKLGFYNATPIVRPVLATGASRTVDDVITVLQTLGLVGQT